MSVAENLGKASLAATFLFSGMAAQAAFPGVKPPLWAALFLMGMSVGLALWGSFLLHRYVSIRETDQHEES